MAESGQTLTFGELDAGANRLSRLFRAAGLQPGDHIALCMENHPRYFEVLWGCEYAGLIYTAASSRLTTDELSYIVNDCGAKAFITSKYKAEQAAELLDSTPAVELRLMLDTTIDGYESYETAVAAHSDEPLEHRIAGRDMLYSSGTTGRPKGVLPAMEAQTIEERVTGVAGMLQVLFNLDASKVYLSPAPLYHAAPLRFCMGTLAIGATLVVMEHFDAENYLRYIEQYQATQPGRADDVREDAQAAGRDPRQLRRVLGRVRGPRRCALSDSRQASDDRVVGSGPPRVLRRHRRQRVRVLQQQDVARPRGYGRHPDQL